MGYWGTSGIGFWTLLILHIHWSLSTGRPRALPSYLHSLLRVYMPSRSLRLVSERYNHKEAQNHAFVHCFLLVEWYSQHYPDNWISDNIQETHTYSNCNLQKKNRCFHYSLVLLCSTLYYFCTKQQCLYCWHFLCLFPLKMNRMLYSSFVNRFR